MEDAEIDTRKQVFLHCKWEQNRPITQNCMAYLAAKRANFTARSQSKPTQGSTEITSISPEKQYEIACDICSAVLSYFDIAAMRVADTIPMTLEMVYIEGFATELERRIGIFLSDLRSDERLQLCADFLRENEDIELKRKTLSDKREALSEAMEILNGI